MRHRVCQRARIAGGLLLAVAVCSPAALAAVLGHAPEPVMRIELEPMGFEGLHTDFMLAGSPMLTVDFVDESHLLVTFEVRRLINREPDAGPNEHDRTVRACLVELPTGKVLAQTEWRLHDRTQYLWNLGGGRFLLRIRDQLNVFAPKADKPQDAFQTTEPLTSERHILAVLVSAEHDLLTVVSVVLPDPAAGDPAMHIAKEPTPAQFNFFRIKTDDSGRLHFVSAGIIRTATPIALPMTTAGLLEIVKTGKTAWAFNFDEYAGKVDELPAFDTTCLPRPVFVDHSQFIAFACRGGDERRVLAGFNLRGEEMWQQGFYESYVSPTFSFAPSAGRFALGRVIVPIALSELDSLTGDMARSQEVRVYQTYSGKQLFQIDCTPIERAGENFALSPDGMRLAVVREVEAHRKATPEAAAYSGTSTGIEIFALPALSEQDQSAVKAAQSAAPADNGVAIDASLARIASSKVAGRGKPTSTGAPPSENASQAAAGQGVVAASGSDAKATGASAGAAGSADTTEGTREPAAAPEPRKPPTLYQPGEASNNSDGTSNNNGGKPAMGDDTGGVAKPENK